MSTVIKPNQIPFAKTLVTALIDQTKNGEVIWVIDAYLTKNDAYHYNLDLPDKTKIDCKLDLDDKFIYKNGSGWFNIKHPKLSDPILVLSNYVPEVSLLQQVIYDKYILPQVQNALTKEQNDLKVLEDIANRTGIQYVRDRKLEGLLGIDTEELLEDPKKEVEKIEPPKETWADKLKRILG